MAPKGIASLFEGASQNTYRYPHNKYNKENKNKITKQKQIIGKLQQRKQKQSYKTKTNYRQFTKQIKHNKRLGIALVETFVH